MPDQGQFTGKRYQDPGNGNSGSTKPFEHPFAAAIIASSRSQVASGKHDKASASGPEKEREHGQP